MSRKTGEVVIPGGRQLSFPYKKAEDCILNKFADDIKLEGVADNTRWLCHFSEVLPQQKWAEECPEVQKGKYKVTKNSPGHQPILGIYQLESSFSKNDLGILVNKKVTTSQQCTLVAKKATRRKRVASRSREVILHLYSLLVRLLLECCISFRAPWHNKDLDVLQQVQYMATKMIKGLEHLLYEERLKT